MLVQVLTLCALWLLQWRFSRPSTTCIHSTGLIVIGWLAVRRRPRHSPVVGHKGNRRLFPRKSQPAVVGRWPVGNGDAAVGRDDDRHDRPGRDGRNAFRPVLLRVAARDGDPRRDARAVLARRAASTRRTSFSSDASTRRRDRSPRFCFSSRARCRAARSSPRRPSSSRRSSAGASAGRVAIIGVPAVLYTMIGGVQAVTWVDVKQMMLIVDGDRRGVDHAARSDSRVAERRAAHRGRRRAGCACSISRSTSRTPTRSGRA